MKKYWIRDINEADYEHVTNIYNSNRTFLLNHLGQEAIDEEFIHKEVSAMQNINFRTGVIINVEKQEIQGVLDYKKGEEVYLSLLMIATNLQGKGIGSEIYFHFEEQMKQLGSRTIRIDVVNDYSENVITFWKKMGFLEFENVILEWGSKKSQAVVMRKSIT